MTAMRSLAARLVRIRPVLRGFKLEMGENGKLHISMRVAGDGRWEIQADARKLIVMFLRRAFIVPAALELELVTTERNGRELHLGEGRIPQAKGSRAPTRPDGTQWNHYEWWGDELPSLDGADPAAATQDAVPQ
jgi:hypothetical protein